MMDSDKRTRTTYFATVAGEMLDHGQEQVFRQSLRSPAPGQLRKIPRPGRNALCWCGSGRKWKVCCGQGKRGQAGKPDVQKEDQA